MGDALLGVNDHRGGELEGPSLDVGGRSETVLYGRVVD